MPTTPSPFSRTPRISEEELAQFPFQREYDNDADERLRRLLAQGNPPEESSVSPIQHTPASPFMVYGGTPAPFKPIPFNITPTQAQRRGRPIPAREAQIIEQERLDYERRQARRAGETQAGSTTQSVGGQSGL